MSGQTATSKTLHRSRSGLRESLRLQRAGVVYAFIAIVICFQLLTVTRGLPAFLQISDIRNIFDQTALDGILVISMTVLLITGNFDLSVGAVAGLSAAVGLTVANGSGSWIGAAVALGVGLGIGLINGLLVQVVGVNAFIVTLGSLTAVQGLLLLTSNGNTILATGTQFSIIGTGNWTVPATLVTAVGAALVVYALVRASGRLNLVAGGLDSTAIAAGVIGALLIVVGVVFPGLTTETRETWIMLAYMTVAAVALRFTVIGRRVYAVGGNGEAARLSGINVSRYKVAAFVLTSLSAGLVGVLYAGKFGAVEPTALVNEELPVLAAAILGGTSLFGGSGYVVKSVIGSLILASLVVGFNLLNLGPNYQYLVQGLVIIAAAAVYTVASRRRRTATTAPTEGETSTDVKADSDGSTGTSLVKEVSA